MSQRRAVLSRYLLATLLVVGVVMALRPIGPGVWPENWFPGADKLLHFGFFLLLWSLGVRARISRTGWLCLGLLLFGVGIELAQGAFSASRNASVSDVMADGAGLLLGAGLTRWGLPGQPEEDRG